MSCAVIICSCGRPDVLDVTLDQLLGQSCPPDQIIVSVVNLADLPRSRRKSSPRVTPIYGPKGSCIQRNAALDVAIGAHDTIIFMDDDYIPAPNALEAIQATFNRFPDVVGMTGTLLADGISSGGIDPDDAVKLARQPIPAQPDIARDNMPALYGCNMAFRAGAIGDIRFDEAMPLYGWQEDVDFSARVIGRKITSGAWTGVHCGVRAGREVSGVRLGYSQVANPFYLWRKGSVTTSYALGLGLRNIGANLRGFAQPEPWIDRRGRLNGNFRAVWDMVRGRAHPRRIMTIPSGKRAPQPRRDTTDQGAIHSRQAR